MADKKRGQGRGRRQQRVTPAKRRVRTGHDSAEDQSLFQELRRALRSDDPLDLLAMVSGLLEVADTRSRVPFARQEDELTVAEIVEPLIGTPYPETTAALMALQALTTDELLARRIDRELAARKHPMPTWLATLEHTNIESDVWTMTHVLGDGTNYIAGVVLPSGHSLSAVVYLDHNLGTVVKDAFIVPESLSDLVIRFGEIMESPDGSLHRTDAATARAVVEEAIDHGARMFPPLTSDSWPMCRPLVEWIFRKLPSGGVAPELKEFSDEEMAAMANDFFASSMGLPFDDEDGRSLFDSLLWFATAYTGSDPFRWSSTRVEELMADWFPRKIIAKPAFLSELPDLLRAFIRYCHDHEQISPILTEETLMAVDAYEPEYQRVIRSSRPQGPAAFLAGMLEEFFDGDIEPEEEGRLGEIMREGLASMVGGHSALQDLDDDPLPGEPFEWSDIPDDIQPVIQEMLDSCDRCADKLLDVEHRTAMRRFLSRAAVADPAIFRRRASPARGAAAVAWVICRANETVGAQSERLSVQELLAWFGVKGSVSQRAEPFLRANGVDPRRLFGSMHVGSPDLLTGSRRADIVASRERWIDK